MGTAPSLETAATSASGPRGYEGCGSSGGGSEAGSSERPAIAPPSRQSQSAAEWTAAV